MVVVVGEIIGRGTVVNNIGHMEIVDTMVPTIGPNPTVINMMLHLKTSKEEATITVIWTPKG